MAWYLIFKMRHNKKINLDGIVIVLLTADVGADVVCWNRNDRVDLCNGASFDRQSVLYRLSKGMWSLSCGAPGTSVQQIHFSVEKNEIKMHCNSSFTLLFIS